tara:strand:- start:78 stop:281 length:204 start_codon:yes stop_codon:yes gene_type:complete
MKVGDLVKNKFLVKGVAKDLTGIIISFSEPIIDSGAFQPIQFAWILWVDGTKDLNPINCIEVVNESR